MREGTVEDEAADEVFEGCQIRGVVVLWMGVIGFGVGGGVVTEVEGSRGEEEGDDFVVVGGVRFGFGCSGGAF